MKELKTQITINASKEAVWNALMDFENYGSWNPFIQKIEGDPTQGKKLKVEITPPGKKKMTFTPVVLESAENRELRWLGHLFVPGLFDGEHFFQLESIDENTTKLTHGEKFTGALSGLLMNMIYYLINKKTSIHGVSLAKL